MYTGNPVPNSHTTNKIYSHKIKFSFKDYNYLKSHLFKRYILLNLPGLLKISLYLLQLLDFL